MNTKDYFSNLLVGAEDWAIDQVREEFNDLLKEIEKMKGERIWSLDANEIPLYVQGKEGENEINSLCTAQEVNYYVNMVIRQSQEKTDLHNELLDLKKHVGQLVDMLEQTEFSDSENPFHLTVIRSCRVQHAMKLDEIMPKITTMVKNKVIKKDTDKFPITGEVIVKNFGEDSLDFRDNTPAYSLQNR
jgi:hypothetical protein